MKTKTIKMFVLSVLLTGLWASCKKDKDLVPIPQPILNSPELMTSMVLLFTDSSNTSNVVTAEFRDPDGPGGNSATRFDTIKLSPNKTYSLSIVVLDETKNPIDSVSKEIWEERNDHQFFFQQTGVNVSTFYLDLDGNNIPVGLSSKWRTKGTSSGTSKIVLKHQPGAKNGSEANGDTDIEVLFQSKIQ